MTMLTRKDAIEGNTPMGFDHDSIDDRIVWKGLREACVNDREISDRTARVIASQWHGGQTTAMYALASSGAIVHNDVWGEVASAYDTATDFGKLMLDYLGTYLLNAGVRGPVEGWDNLHW